MLKIFTSIFIRDAAAAAAAAKSLHSCPTLCDPTDSSSAGSPVHRVLQVRILEWVAISLSSDESRAVLNYYRSNDS